MGFFGFLGSVDESNNELPSIYNLSLSAQEFIDADILATYAKILTDTVERIHGLKPEQEKLLWDNCVMSESSKGLISLLADAMAKMSDLYLIYKPSLGVLRKADSNEEQVIRADYQKSGKSVNGVFISFKNYKRTEMLKVYSSFEYCVLASLNKTLNLSKAVQFKMSDLRKSVALADKEVVRAQAKSISEALGCGKDVMIDKEDEIANAAPDTSSAEKAIAFLDAKKSFYLALPMSYIMGEQTAGIGSTGEADMRAVERGLKQYYVSILRPVLDAVFNATTEFKSQDFRQMSSALEALRTFDLVTDEVLSREAKQEILWRMFEINAKKEKKALAAQPKVIESNPDENDEA